MKKFLILGGVVFLCILIFVIYQLTKTPSIHKGNADMSDVSESNEKQISAFMSENIEATLDDIEFYRTPEGTLQYFLAVAMLGEINLVPEVFTSEQFNKDFMSILDVSERMETIAKALKDITRNNSLDKVEILRGMWTFHKDTVRIVADLYYTDLAEPIRLNVLLREMHYEHIPHGDNTQKREEFDVYHIETSIFDMITKIQEGDSI